MNFDTSRAGYQIRPGRTAYAGGPYTEGYSSCYYKLQSDLADVQTAGWRVLCAIANDAVDKSVVFQVVVSGGSFIWRLLGKPGVADEASDWTVDNDTVAVPVGEWFQLQFAWSPTYVGVKINGALVCEYTSAYVTDVRFWDVIQCYAQVTQVGAGIVSQANDDMEVRLGPGSIPHEWTRGNLTNKPSTTTGGPQSALRPFRRAGKVNVS